MTDAGTNPQASTRHLVGAREAAAILGISPRLLWTLTARAEVPHVHIARRILYEPHDLWAWVRARKHGGGGVG